MSASYDYIVVGGGTAGCVVAARLCEDTAVRVLLIEAGPKDRNPFIAIPGAAAFTLAAPELNWHRMTEPQAMLGGRSLYLAQGKVLGGSSSINGLVYTRGSRADYDNWVEQGAAGWSYDDVLPWFRKAQAHADGADALRGGDGPLQVRHGSSPLGAVDAFLDGAGEIGLPRSDDLNLPEGEGIGHYDWMIGKGRRSSAARAYLRPKRHQPNLEIVTGTRARQIRVTGNRATGVDYAIGKDLHSANADREVILCGGAINSPCLLMLSGIGPADHLREMGISPVLDQPMVGANLRNHLSYQFSYRTRRPVSAYRYLNPLYGGIEVARYALGRKGFLADAAAAAGGFYRSSDNEPTADMQAFMVPIILGGLGSGIRALLPREHGLSFFVNQGRPHSHGTVRLRSADPDDPPVIDPRYLGDSRDMEITVRGVARIMDIARTRAFAKVGAAPVGGPASASAADIETSIRSHAGNHYHVSGTCRMGREPATSVVDPQLRPHGLDGLRVVDASVMPALINANLAAPVIMIAERAAAFIRGATA